MSASKHPRPREAEAALKRTTDWARRARVYFQECARRNGNLSQWQFGIVQGRPSRICGAKVRASLSIWIFQATPLVDSLSASRTKSLVK